MLQVSTKLSFVQCPQGKSFDPSHSKITIYFSDRVSDGSACKNVWTRTNLQ